GLDTRSQAGDFVFGEFSYIGPEGIVKASLIIRIVYIQFNALVQHFGGILRGEAIYAQRTGDGKIGVQDVEAFPVEIIRFDIQPVAEKCGIQPDVVLFRGFPTDGWIRKARKRNATHDSAVTQYIIETRIVG